MTAIFTHRSIIKARVADVFRWHERAEALRDLMPAPRLVRLEKREGTLRDGGIVDFSVGIGPFRVRWQARHYGYVPGQQFCDEQIRGPFEVWRHTHRFEPIGDGHTLYEDRVEYAVPGGPLAERLAESVLRPILGRLFASRHRIVRKKLEQRTWIAPQTFRHASVFRPVFSARPCDSMAGTSATGSSLNHSGI